MGTLTAGIRIVVPGSDQSRREHCRRAFESEVAPGGNVITVDVEIVGQ